MALCNFTRSQGGEVYVNPKLVVAVYPTDHTGTSILMQVADWEPGPLVIAVHDDIEEVVKRLDQAARS